MDSCCLKCCGWRKIGEIVLKQQNLEFKIEVEDLAEKKGLYAFIYYEKFYRLNGSTDILYIGRTDNSFKKRFQQYKNPQKDQPTNKRVKKILKELLNKKENSIEIFVLPIEDSERLKKEEKKYLKEFQKEHLELPPLNRSS